MHIGAMPTDPVKVFISWSGERSQAVAEALRDFLPDVIAPIVPWMSRVDIDPGARWSHMLSAALDTTDIGILCLTPENKHEDWLLFEAGALAKSVERSAVIPYLIGMEPADVPRGPLTQFQAVRANREETWRLVGLLNQRLGNAVADDRLRRLFDRAWPDVEAALVLAPAVTDPATAPTPVDSVLAEILDTVRELSRRMAETKIPGKDLAPELRDQLAELAEYAAVPGWVLPELSGPFTGVAIEFERDVTPEDSSSVSQVLSDSNNPIAASTVEGRLMALAVSGASAEVIRERLKSIFPPIVWAKVHQPAPSMSRALTHAVRSLVVRKRASAESKK